MKKQIRHKHRCDKCGRIWSHSDNEFGKVSAHTCKCGEIQWDQYEGKEK